tara:strand:+ start:198 stop:374 length:177 start_codon:yes stop_codon:yes gene_type:complete
MTRFAVTLESDSVDGVNPLYTTVEVVAANMDEAVTLGHKNFVQVRPGVVASVVDVVVL